MRFGSTHRKRKEPHTDDENREVLKTFGPRGYWSWSEVYHDYYHRRKNGSYKWMNASKSRAMAEALEYAKLSKQADSTGTARGVRITFSKVPGSLGSLAFLNRRITPGSSSHIPSFTNPRVSGEYEISYSPTLRNSSVPGVKLGFVSEPYDERGGYNKTFTPWSGVNNAKPAGGLPISRVSLSKGKGIFAPSIRTNVRELSLSKIATDTRMISHIRVVVHDASSHTKSLKTTKNHWSIYLILLNQMGTVRVEMTISESNTEILEWTLLSYPLSLSKIRDWDFQVVPKITVGRFYKLIHDNGRHRYVMGRESSCDRFWIYAIISDLVGKGWLVNGRAREEIWEYLQHFYSLGGESRRVGMMAGLFY